MALHRFSANASGRAFRQRPVGVGLRALAFLKERLVLRNATAAFYRAVESYLNLFYLNFLAPIGPRQGRAKKFRYLNLSLRMYARLLYLNFFG